MKLNTLCNNCINVERDSGSCKIGKDAKVYSKNLLGNIVTIDGICRDKMNTKNPTLYVQDLTAIIYFTNIEELTATLNNLCRSTYISELIIFVPKPSGQINKACEELLSQYNVRWQIEMMLDDKLIQVDPHILDWCIDKVNSNNVLFLYAGDTIDIKELDKYIDNCCNDNYACGDIDMEHGRMVFHKPLFVELEKNRYQLFINKLMSFENWKQLCPKITLKSQSSHQPIITASISQNTSSLYLDNPESQNEL